MRPPRLQVKAEAVRAAWLAIPEADRTAWLADVARAFNTLRQSRDLPPAVLDAVKAFGLDAGAQLVIDSAQAKKRIAAAIRAGFPEASFLCGLLE